ncbi:MAG: VWA domain-containing protein [Gammaproteobacteria bacterium]|nr:VWA domain-containing protein [Gammaproteobacteria bacterium]
MNPNRWIKICTLILITLISGPGTAAAAQQEADKTLSPYFLVTGPEEGTAEQFPLESTSADVTISGVIATVTVQQVYRNRGIHPLEAVYIFPGSTRAAVNAMKMIIGERVVEARIEEKQTARAIHEQAKQAGKRSSLLEQMRPNVFRMNVANILPDDRVKVVFTYTELLIPESGEYEFVYPTVVGPRYNGEAEALSPGGNAWVSNPYLKEGTATPNLFHIELSIAAGLPLQSLNSPSHELKIAYQDQTRATASLDDEDHGGGDRDFVLRYRLKGKAIESGLLLHRGKDENYFLLMAQPPRRVVPNQIPPREYIFVVDVSGSMHGFPLNTTKRLMSELLSALRPRDSFNILFFSGGSRTLAETPLPATKTNIRKAISMMENQRGGGGTRMLDAIQKAMNISGEPGIARSFILVTDGFVSVETDTFDYVKRNLNNANFFTFGIGTSVNRFLIEGLARSGRGEPFVILNPEEAPAVAKRFRSYIESPVLTGIEVDFGELGVYEQIPASVPDLFADRPLILFGKWRGETKGSVTVSGYGGEGRFQSRISIPEEHEEAHHPALRYLWARHRIAELGDYQKIEPNDEQAMEITALGLEYNLLTSYTSFVAVDEAVVNPGGSSKKVKQPLPLPKGISNFAVGGQIPTAPEPEINALIMVLAGFGLWRLLRRHKAKRQSSIRLGAG